MGSSGYYAESAEILNKQRVHRVRPSVPVQGFNIVGGGLNIKPKVQPVVSQARSAARPGSKSDRRIDSTEDLHVSLESVDFDDVSGEKQRKVLTPIDNNSNDQETQITAESSSFVSGSSKRRNGIGNGNSNNISNNNNNGPNSSPNSSDDASILKPARSRNGSSQERSSQQRGPIAHTESRERARNGQRGQQRYKDLESEEQHSKEKGKEKLAQTSTPKQDKPEFFEAHSSRPVQHTTPYFIPSSYSTARRLEPSKSTPFYTPTVPSVSKSKSTEGKFSYVKGGYSATTPNPNRFGVPAISGLFLESSVAPKHPKPTASSSLELDSTYRPVIIGMRHHYDVASSGELKRLSASINANVEQPSNKLSESRDYLPTTPAPTASSSGPTYLPKSAAVPRLNAAAAGGDSLLFAPSPVKEESVYRNVQDMLKTVNLLKDKFEDVELNAQSATAVRAGLEIPPSSGPDALVSLAKYFAQEHNESSNSLVKPEKSGAHTKLSVKAPASNLPAAKPSDMTAILTTSETPPGISEQADDIKQSLLSDKTVQKYSNLFGLKAAQGRGAGEGQADISSGLLSVQLNETQAPGTATRSGAEYQPFPQIGSTGSTIGALAEQPESRKIAQIFSNALSSYLDNPGSFRAELATRARPTEPPNFKQVTTTDASLFSDGTAKYYLPTKPAPDVTTPQSIAVEINHKFDSTPAPDYSTTTTELYELSTSRAQDSELELSAELSPASPDSGEGEDLLRQHTQSFVKSRNDLLQDSRPQKLITTHKPTENPWALKSQTDFLDPLTINDALMKEQRATTTTTLSPFTYLPRLLQAATTTPAPGPAPAPARYEWDDIFRSYDIPRDALPSSSGLQRIANKLFGGLNEQEALHLRNVMAKAEHDRQVLSLLLLLIQTCDDHNGKALERSRKHLLNALIDIDSKIPSKSASRQKLSTPTTTSRLPVTTFRRNGNVELYTSTTPGYTSTTEVPLPTSTTAPGSYEETTKFEIRVEDVDDSELTATTAATPAHGELNSDRRALELLKSLYSLASKFSSRR